MMGSLAVFPTLLVFGPQTNLPSLELLAELRQELIANPRLACLQKAIQNLPKFWQTLSEFDATLNRSQGAKYLSDLQQWIDNGVFPQHLDSLPNVFVLPLTVILQILLYVHYLNTLHIKDAHRHVLQAAEAGGTQGFCVGFLTAIAVNCAQSEEDIAEIGAVSLRLAVLAGAYVDQDGCFAVPPNQTACIAVRWRTGSFNQYEVVNLIRTYPEAYISSINDDACVTVTALASDIAGMTENFHARGLRVSPVHVQGRFHSAVHSSAVEKIVKFCDTSDEMQFPTVDKLQVLLRSSLDAKIVMTGSLTSLALENMLLEAPDWYGTVKAAILQLPVGHKVVGFVGFGNHVPASLLQTPGLQVQLLGHEEPNLRRPLETPHANGFKNGTTVGGTRASTNGTSSQVELPDPEYPPHSIAIVGMACRLPEAESVDEFWQLLLSGASIVEPAPERLNLPKTGDYSNTQWWGSFLRDPDAFDHRFFKKSSREALAWDPQLRILIEVVYEAMESSGYFGTAPKTTPSDWGCYIGAVMSNWYDNVSCHPPTAYATTGTSRPFFSGAVSHHFGWTGPALTIDTACSSSLVAINAACRAVMSGECSRAIAGGTNVFTSPFDYRNLQAAGFLSPTGGCKPFDVSGDGYCRGEGIGVVVLKPLADALKENDNILGVIVGSAVNQNENGSHITVPHSGSQINLYKKVMSLAGVEPEAVTYVEAHGTGTGVGDPIESQSIRQAFGGPMRDRTLHFGSVKGNIGHTESTAGVAGIIKVLLMMQHGKIPPQANFSSLNPNIPPLEPDRMEISRKTIPWTPPVHLACVNSYGAAGSNAAVMVRQKPGHAALTNVHKAVKQMSTFPFFISAASASSLSMYCDKLLACVKDLELQQTSQTLLSDLAFNLADRANHSLPHVLSTTVTDVADLEKKLIDIISGANNFKSEVNQNLKPVVFVFGGQENDFVGISEDFSQSFSLFRKHLDQCNTMLISLGFESIYPAVFQRTPISNIVTLHSALFSVQYSSAKAWMDCGLSVSAVIGHSFGQLTALCISGCLSLEDALRLVAGRASIMLKYWGPERGSMLWLGTNRQKVTEILDSLNPQLNGDYIEIACHNGPESHVAVGSANSIAKLENFLANDPSLRGSVRMKKLRVTNGFHSKFTDPLLPHITALAKSLRWKAPAIYLETCDEAESIDEPDYRLVADHTRRPVFFEHAVKRLAHKYAHCTWLETGFGPSFMNLVKGSLAAHLQPKQLFLAPQLTASNAESSLAEITATLWKAGYGAQYWLFHRSQKQKYQFLTLPPYQFEKSRHWLPFLDRAGPAEIVAPEVVEEPPNYELLSFVKFADNSKNEAIFRVSPQSERYQFLVNGHIMAGQALAPASLSFELAARAAIFLQGDSGDDTYVPCVESLHMMSPLGLDIKKDILLSLTRIQDSRSSWSFNITTQAQGANISERFEHTTGTVYLEKRDDIRAAQGFKRFEKLIGSRHDEILNNVEAEKMQGKHVYRAFNTVVFYGEQFRGIKSVSCVRLEAAGKVVISVDPEAAPDQRLCDTPMTDSFMQFAGFLVNYFNNPSMEDVFVCHKIERIEIGGGFTPDAKEWVVYSTMTEDGEREATSDVYVFEAESKKLVMAAFGFHFSRMSQSLLARMLKSVNRSGETSKLTSKATVEKIDIIPLSPSETSTKASASKRAELLDVLHNVTDVPLEEIKDELSLDDLGIDSLMATELLNDIRATFGLAIDLMTFLEFKNVREVWIYLDSKLGIPDLSDTPVSSEEMNFSAQNGIPTDASSTAEHFPEAAQEQTNEPTSSSSPTITSAYAAFETIQYEYDQLATETKAANFWTEVYPDQARLVLAYVVEAFASLGCDMESFQPGDIVSEIESQPRHKNLVRQLYHVLEDAHLISVCDGSFFRTNVPVDTTPAENLYQEILGLHPESANVHKLVKVIGADLAACLTGEKDGLQLVFGNKANKENLGDVYENWPLLRTPTLLLGDFLLNAFSNSTGSGKFRILEVGAGTGGTTRHIVNHLKSHGINFEYTFTDLSASLVSAAKKYFKGAEGMKFEVLDIEKPPVPEHVEAFHVIIATNCIHATRNLDQSLRHLRKMIREDGVLSLVEITKNMFWLDIAVGLFEGWWLFEDGRTHALATETHWELCMKGVGFQNVAWTDGNRAEAKTVRIIAALPRARPDAKKESKRTPQASMETVVYKKFGDTEIHADVYYPLSSETTARKMPIALMIHGGSHIIFSRKDIRPPQTRLLLEKGFLPVSLDHRLCPEVSLSEGGMVDVCDALEWARNKLPHIQLQRSGLQIDGERVVVVGWSSGGQLAMSLAWTAPQRGLRPPEAILAFYCPTDYQDEWWRNPIQPVGAEDTGAPYDLLEAIQDEPVTNYAEVGAWTPLSDPRIRTDPRCRIVLHINWKAQTLPVIMGGLPSKSKLAATSTTENDYHNLPQPAEETIVKCSPRAQIVRGNYSTPTFLVHGTNDELIPYQQTEGTFRELVKRGVPAGLRLVEGAPHICDLSSDVESEGWKAVVGGYEFLASFV